MATSQAKALQTSDSDAKKFNTNLIKLFEQLMKVYPEDRDIRIYRDKITMLSKANSKMPSEYYVSFCQRFITPIMTGDYQFFINFDYAKTYDLQDDKYLKLIHKIIHLWQNTSNETLKQTIIKYLQILLVHAIKCHHRKDLLPELNKYRQTPLTL